MDARELQKLWHELLDKNPTFEQFARNLSFVVSYLISEQDKRKELVKQIEEHSKAMTEAKEQRAAMAAKVDQIYDRQEKNARLLGIILKAVVTGAVTMAFGAVAEILRIAWTHKP